MAATFTLAKVTGYADANKKARVYDVTAAGTYTTGGDALSASALGFRKVEQFIVHNGATDGTVIYPVIYVYSTGLVKLFESGGTAGVAGAEKGSGESMTGITFRVTVHGF